MKRMTKLFTALALALGLTTAAQAALNHTQWSTIATSAATGTYNPNGIVYANNQCGLAIEVNFDANALNSYTILDFNGDNRVRLLTNSQGKYQVIVNGSSELFNVTSEVSATEGRHVFAVLVRRGVSGGGGHVVSVLVNLDGERLFTVGDGTKSFQTGPIRNATCGQSGSANVISGSCWTSGSMESAGNTTTDETKIAEIQADADTIYAPLTKYTAEISSGTEWKDITWSETITDPSKAALELTVTGNPTITMDDCYAYASVKIIGDATFVAADGLYENGCWQKTLLGGAFTATGTIAFGAVKSDFTGAYAQTANGITLRAQNKEVISINFANGQSVSGTGYTGLAPVQGNTWMNMTTTWSGGGKTVDLGTIKVTADGATTTDRTDMSGSCYAANTYGWNTATDVFLKGYLDDGGNHAQVYVNNIPYSTYDVIIYCATDNGSAFDHFNVNDVDYKCGSDGVGVAGTGTWGTAKQLVASFGVNAMIIKNQNRANLAIKGTRSSGRGCIAAVQIVCTGDVVTGKDFTATITEDATFSEIDWDGGETFEEGLHNTAAITIGEGEGEVAITFDNPALTLSTIKIISAERDVKFVATEPLSNVSAFDVSECAGMKTYAWPVTALATSADTKLAYAGGTAGETAVGIAHGAEGTVLNLTGGTYKLSETHANNAVTYNVTDSTLNYPDCIGLGKGTYNFGGSSAINTPKFVLVQGSGNSDEFNLTDDAEVNVSGTVIEDTNQNSVMFGHWAGNSTFTISDYAAFTAAETQILIGKTGGNHTINVDGGTITTKGIRTSGNATGTNTLNLNGGALTLGDIGITAYGNTLKVNVTDNSTITASGTALPITQPIDVAADMTLTIDGTGANVSLTGAITGEGTILISGGYYNIGEARVPPTLPEQVTLGDDVVYSATQTRLEYAQGLASEFTGFTEGQTIVLNKLDGSTEELTVDAEGTATSTPGAVHIDGASTLFDVTFTNYVWDMAHQYDGFFSYKAVPAATLQYDTPATFANTNGEAQVKDIGVYIRHHPYINKAASTFNALGDFTGVFVGEMSPTANRIFVYFGSSSGSNQGIMITTLAGKDAVGVFSNVGSTLTELTQLSVPNAATARHVYIITKKEVAGDTVFTIYLDGVKRAEKTIAGKFVLGAPDHCGVQVGADFGGGLRYTTDYKEVDNVETETGVLNVCRIYDYLLTDAQVTELTTQYPYISDGGLYERTVEGEANYAEEASWAKNPSTTPEYDVPTGTEKFLPSATLTASADAVVTVNTNSDIDVFTFNGSAMSFVKDEEGTNKVSVGTAVINAPITIEYGALDLSKASVSLAGNGAVTFDLEDFPLNSFFASTKIQMTGLTDRKDTKITATNIPESEGREAELLFEDGVYNLVVTVEDHPFVYNVGWTWNDDPVDVAIVSNNTAQAIIVQSNLEWPIDRSGITVEAGTLTATAVTKRAADVTVEADAVLDLNGNQAKEMALTLNGGKVTYGNTKLGEADQIKELTLTADSEINTTVKGQIYAASYGTATTIALDTYTLTKTGEDILQVVNTDITGMGTIDIQEGEFYGSEDTRATNVTFKIAEGATLHNRGGKTMTIAKIVGEGGTLNNEGTMPAFAISGTLNIANAGSFQTNMLVGATVNIGQKRGLVFSGAGTVNAVLTDAEIAQEGPITIFEVEEGLTDVEGGTVVDKDGKPVPGSFTGGTYQVDHEAKIGTTYYLTLQDALNAGGDVVMLKDVAKEVTIPAGKTVNLDFNGCAITTTSRQAINNHGTLTIANGNITAQESAIVLWGNSTTTISGGAYTSRDNAVIMGSGNEGEGNVTLNITGGTFNGNIESAGYIACGIYVPNSGTYTISGGQFNITGGCGICARAGEIKVASEAEFNIGFPTDPGKVGDSPRLVPCVAMYTDYEAGYPGHAETDYLKAQNNALSTYTEQGWFGPDEEEYYTLAKIDTAEAKIADGEFGATTYYLTLQDALNVGGDVVMLKSVAKEVTVPAGKDVNLDFNGCTITTTSRQAINNYGRLTIENGNVTAQEAAIVLWGGSVTSISGGTYTSKDNAVIMGNGNAEQGDVALHITGGTFNGGIQTAGYIACGVYVANTGLYNIKGGTFNITGGVGVLARAGGTLIGGAMCDVTFNVTAPAAPGKVGDKAQPIDGAVFAFDASDPAYPGYVAGESLIRVEGAVTLGGEGYLDNVGIYGDATITKLATVKNLTAPEGYEWKGDGSSNYEKLAKKSDTPTIPEEQGKIVPVPGQENTYAVSNTTDTVDISNLPEGATVLLDASVVNVNGVQSEDQIKIVAAATNETTETVIDITGAFTITKGTGTMATIALDPAAEVEVTIGGTTETIPVTPEVNAAAATPIDPKAETTDVAAHTIPGLTYQLTRSDTLEGTPTFTEVGEAVKAKGTNTPLVDPTTKSTTGASFYKIKVSQ